MRHDHLHPGLAPVALDAVAHVLNIAGDTAQRSWNPDDCDIYHCLSRAWRATAKPTPYTALTAAVRKQLHSSHSGMAIGDFNNIPGLTGDDVAALLKAAAHATMPAHPKAPTAVTEHAGADVHLLKLPTGQLPLFDTPADLVASA